jgi:hypothetical protein
MDFGAAMFFTDDGIAPGEFVPALAITRIAPARIRRRSRLR